MKFTRYSTSTTSLCRIRGESVVVDGGKEGSGDGMNVDAQLFECLDVWVLVVERGRYSWRTVD